MAEPNRQLLAKVWRPLLRELSKSIERACLRRDAYLDHVFAHEAKVLKDEIPCSNSPEARAYLQSKLDDLDRVHVNFSLSPATIEVVNRACAERNVIRDCFINRVLFLLFADINICEAVIDFELREHLGDILGDNDRDFLYAPLWDGSLSVISGIVSSDPFEALRNVIAYRQEQGDKYVKPLHACLIEPCLFPKKPPGVLALNCYLPDERIPGSPAAKRHEELMEEILGMLNDENPNDPKPENESVAAE